MVTVREDFVLAGQEGTARIHQVDARQAVLAGNFLGTQVLFHRKWEIGAAFYRGVVGHNHALNARHPTNPGDHACGRYLTVVNVMRRQRGKLQKRRAFINQMVDAVTHVQLATALMAGAGFLTASLCNGRSEFTEFVDFPQHGGLVGLKHIAARVDLCGECAHGAPLLIFVKGFR